jgi:hypothetical protein
VIADRRGVSEAVSFVLVFSLVISTVGIVYTVGYADLKGARDAEQVNNVQRAFDLLAENLDELVARSAPSRGTEIRLQGGTLSSGPPVYVNVSGDYDTGIDNQSEDFSTTDVATSPIVYEAPSGTTITYAHGAIIRSEDTGGDVFVRDPSFVLDEERFLVPLVGLRSADNDVGGRTTVLVRTQNSLSDVIVDRPQTYDEVTVNVTSPRAPAWESYLTERGLSCTTPTSDHVSCTATDVQRVYVLSVTVDVNFE